MTHKCSCASYGIINKRFTTKINTSRVARERLRRLRPPLLPQEANTIATPSLAVTGGGRRAKPRGRTAAARTCTASPWRLHPLPQIQSPGAAMAAGLQVLDPVGCRRLGLHPRPFEDACVCCVAYLDRLDIPARS